MPRENRKRGKKHKKKAEEDTYVPREPTAPEEQEPEAGPSWIIQAPDASGPDPNAPFGYVDAEVKAYFRTVDVQIREWQDERAQDAPDEDVDPNEDRRMFFIAALTEMSEKEKQLATDPDCSTILERMMYSMDDFVRRVFLDRLSGSLEQLVKHRFASHVCQTLLTVAGETISRESRGVFPPVPDSGDEGELRTMTRLVVEACEELLPSVSSLIMDPFASHVMRALLLLLAPDVLDAPDDRSARGKAVSAVRSKKSTAYKARQGAMKSVFSEAGTPSEVSGGRRPPKEFRKVVARILKSIRDELGENEVRALAANQVASPVLQMLLEVESQYGEADVPNSLMDRVSVGLITISHTDPAASPEASDYLTTLLRDPIASHLLETLVRRSPAPVFNLLWNTYFTGKLSKLAVHPVANFVVATAVERLDVNQLASACQESEGVASKIVKNSRTGVLRALVDRAAALQSGATRVVELLSCAFELTSQGDKESLVPCLLRLQTPTEYQAALRSAQQDDAPPANEDPARHRRRKADANADPLEPKTQGAVLLQSMLRLPDPHNAVVLNSLQSLGVDDLIAMAHHVTSSRVLDAVLESPTVPHKAKRTFVMTFLGRYHDLVDDRIGSRVGDRCWAFADPYLREKIARSLIPHEHAVAGSFYGKFFARRLNLHMLQRDPERWKTQQAASKNSASTSTHPLAKNPTPSQADKSEPTPAAAEVPAKAEKRKRKARPDDEIEALFDAALGPKVKKAELSAETMEKPSKGAIADRALADVLGAIRAAPSDDKKHKKRRKGL